MNNRSISRKWTVGTFSLMVPPAVVALLVGLTLLHRPWNAPFFVYTAYYVQLSMLAVSGVVLFSGWAEAWSPRTWVRDNVRGIVTAAVVGTTALCAVAPGYRVLADEADLIAVSKNLFFQKTANFAVTGKWYFENYWNLNQEVDRRPTLFPFLVNLVHSVRGYHPENAFHLNAILLILFVFVAYRLAKSLRGEVFGVAAAILVATSPNTLVAARSAGFDLLATLALLCVVLTFHDYAKAPSPRGLALFSLSACMLAHVRVEGLGFAAVAALALLSLRICKWTHLKGFGFVYSMLPVFLASRFWQSMAKANDAEQPLSTSLFSRANLSQNLRDYLGLLAHPLEFDGPHAPLLMICAVAGCLWAAVLFVRGAHDVWSPEKVTLARFHRQLAVFIGALVVAEVLLSFSYAWGHPSQPASARLFLWLDTLVAFVAAWFLTLLGERVTLFHESVQGHSRAAITTIACGALLVMHLPVASEARFANALILTRQAAQLWRFFDSLGEKRILILTDRPVLFTIKDYGARDISVATTDRQCLLELSRHLFQDIYLVQNIDLKTNKPQPGYEAWADVPTEPVLEFQTTDSLSSRIVRVVH